MSCPIRITGKLLDIEEHGLPLYVTILRLEPATYSFLNATTCMYLGFGQSLSWNPHF